MLRIPGEANARKSMIRARNRPFARLGGNSYQNGRGVGDFMLFAAVFHEVTSFFFFFYIQSNFTIQVTYLTLLTNYFTILQGRIPRRANIYGNSVALT